MYWVKQIKIVNKLPVSWGYRRQRNRWHILCRWFFRKHIKPFFTTWIPKTKSLLYLDVNIEKYLPFKKLWRLRHLHTNKKNKWCINQFSSNKQTGNKFSCRSAQANRLLKRSAVESNKNPAITWLRCQGTHAPESAMNSLAILIRGARVEPCRQADDRQAGQ